MDDDQKIQEDLLRSMVALSKTRKRVKKQFPVLTFDRKTMQLLGVQEREWRGRRVPRDADTRSLLLTAYVGLVLKNEPFLSRARHLRQTFPDLKPGQGGAMDFFIQQLEQRQLLHAYNEGQISIEDALPRPDFEELFERERRDYVGDYDRIYWNSVLDLKHPVHSVGPGVSMERRYLCSRCGLHFLATALFARASYGPRITHQLVWDPELWWSIGQIELGVFSIPKDSTGHGRAGMWLETYEQVEAVTRNLFLQQVEHRTPQILAEKFSDNTLRVRKELERARQVLGMRRKRGKQTTWMSRVPGKPCTNCRSLIRREAFKLAEDGVSLAEIASRVGAKIATVRRWLSDRQ